MNKFLTLCLFLWCASLTAQNNENIQLANEYYGQGEYEKARTLYEELARNPTNIPLIHNNYFFLLLETADFRAAEKYIKQLIKQWPANWYYRLNLGFVYYRKSGESRADSYFKEMINDIRGDTHLMGITAEYFVDNQLTQYAIYALKESRKFTRNPYLFALELANIYRITNEKKMMVREYLNYVIQRPSNLEVVKNTLQTLLSEPGELESLELLLLQKMQQEPNNNVYSELLIWANLQQKNFFGAFVQARALDKRLRSEGERTLSIGFIALENGDFDNAIKIFTYLTKTYPKSRNYRLAKMHLIKAYEEKVRNTYPIDKQAIRNLIADYDQFIRESGINNNTLAALRNKASLHAFYLDEKELAIQILKKIINMPQADARIKAESKLDMGDIYLLTGQPWESSLLYSQVEKSHKEDNLGYEAKLRNAKLSYYRGDFALAGEHLDILKEATTRKIANDAMALSLLIKDNTALDTSDYALMKYAEMELLLYQNKVNAALVLIDDLLQKLPDHSLVDELLWKKAHIKMKMGLFEASLRLLEQITGDHGEDILGDDAYFTIADIYDRPLKDAEKAMTYYRDFLTKYPGSVFVAEARKRFRTLRGDFDAQKENILQN